MFEIEERMRVPRKFRFPSYEAVNWLAAQKLKNDLSGMNYSSLIYQILLKVNFKRIFKLNRRFTFSPKHFLIRFKWRQHIVPGTSSWWHSFLTSNSSILACSTSIIKRLSQRRKNFVQCYQE